MASGLVTRAEPVAEHADIWLLATGGANLPLKGNGENLLALLRGTEYSTVAIR